MGAKPTLKAMFDEARRLSQAGRDAEATVLFRRLVAAVPDDPVLAYNLATTLLRQGLYEEGFRLYEARAYVPGAHVVKPEYKPAPLPLSREDRETWGAQTMLLGGHSDEEDDDPPRSARL